VSKGTLKCEQCNFEENFSFEGGILHLTSNGLASFLNSIFYTNFAVKSALMFSLESI